MVLIRVSLINNVEHLLMCLLAIQVLFPFFKSDCVVIVVIVEF